MILKLRGDEVIIQGTQVVSRETADTKWFVPVITFPTTTLRCLSESRVFTHTLCLNAKPESVADSFSLEGAVVCCGHFSHVTEPDTISCLFTSVVTFGDSAFLSKSRAVFLFKPNHMSRASNPVIPAPDSSFSLLELNFSGRGMGWGEVTGFPGSFAKILGTFAS